MQGEQEESDNDTDPDCKTGLGEQGKEMETRK